jgi:hypothetical protein
MVWGVGEGRAGRICQSFGGFGSGRPGGLFPAKGRVPGFRRGGVKKLSKTAYFGMIIIRAKFNNGA